MKKKDDSVFYLHNCTPSLPQKSKVVGLCNYKLKDVRLWTYVPNLIRVGLPSYSCHNACGINTYSSFVNSVELV